ncbi:MAG: ABC transporter permease [Spirochaetes bacterium]|nr:ABC transporter permease [Spirochaetota bacterium]HPA71543.1 ABC transporter permease [Spirochaetota bacterium]
MDIILDGLKQAFLLVARLDAEVLSVSFLTLQVTLTATAISMVLGVAAGTAVALNEFPGRSLVVGLVNTGMGVPPVVVGLFTTILLWRNGLLGELELLYTPSAIVIAQVLIATPMVTGITLSSIQQIPKSFRLQVLALGASRLQMLWYLYREARLPLLAAVMAGFGSVVSEVGAAIMVGGNIRGHTRVLTTATVMETSRGNFDMAIALGVILMVIAFSVNYALSHLQQRSRQR